jgi:drug/metabolite transporter (DMT)-like permease
VTNPYGVPPDAPDQPGRIRGWAVAIGIVLGLVGTVVWMTAVFVVAYSLSSEQSRSAGNYDWLIFVLFILPLPLSILSLCFRRTRQAAAGFVMGVAIGVLVLAGLCSSFFVPGLTA